MVSWSYDKTLPVWDLDTKPDEVETVDGAERAEGGAQVALVAVNDPSRKHPQDVV